MNKIEKIIELIDKLGMKVYILIKRIATFLLDLLKNKKIEDWLRSSYKKIKSKCNINRVIGICTLVLFMVLSITAFNSLFGKSYRGVIDEVITGMIECDSSKILNNVPDEILDALKQEYTKENGYTDDLDERMVKELNYNLKKQINEEVNWEYGYKWTYTYKIESIVDYNEEQIADYLDKSEYTSNFDKIKKVEVVVSFKNKEKVLGTQEMYLTVGYRSGSWYYLVI